MPNCEFFVDVSVSNLEFWVIDSKYEGTFKIEGVEGHSTEQSSARTTSVKENNDGSSAQVNVSKAKGRMLTLNVAYGSPGHNRLQNMLRRHHDVGMDCFEIIAKNITSNAEERHNPVTFIDTGASIISSSVSDGEVDNVDYTFFSGGMTVVG